MLTVKQGSIKYHFLKVFGMTQSWIEHQSPGSLVNIMHEKKKEEIVSGEVLKLLIGYVHFTIKIHLKKGIISEQEFKASAVKKKSSNLSH